MIVELDLVGGILIPMLMFIGWIVWRAKFARSSRLVRRVLVLAAWTFGAVLVSFAISGFAAPTITAAALSFVILVAEVVSAAIGATPKDPKQAPKATALRRDHPS